jgi:hypothetical protein
VSYDETHKGWKAYFRIAGKKLHLGMFNSQLEAAKQVDRCALLSCWLTCATLRAFLLRSGVYKLEGDSSGAHCGVLSDAEKAELDKMTLEKIKEKWARVNPKTIKKAGLTSKYRGVCWCAA